MCVMTIYYANLIILNIGIDAFVNQSVKGSWNIEFDVTGSIEHCLLANPATTYFLCFFCVFLLNLFPCQRFP